MLDKALFTNDEIALRTQMNLGTFSTTQMLPESLEIFQRYTALNAVDLASYPELEHMINEVGDYLLQQFHAPDSKSYVYFPTSGSSEAVFISVLMMKSHWLRHHSAPEKKLNLVLMPKAHVAFNVAAKVLDIEIRTLDFDENKNFSQSILEQLDQHTMGVICSLGDTMTLYMDDIAAVDRALVQYHDQFDHFIPIHVDAASGGFIAPYYYPKLVWDFRLNHVKAINVSSHKYGLVYPSLGWLCVHQDYADSSMLHENKYLGKTFKRYPIQFSHSAANLAAQYMNLKVLGYEGYTLIARELYFQMTKLCESLKQMEQFKLITPNHHPAIPGIIFTMRDQRDRQTLLRMASYLNALGWHLPTYPLPHYPDQPIAARILIRYGFSNELRERLVADIKKFR